jgi:hypothetical protein
VVGIGKTPYCAVVVVGIGKKKCVFFPLCNWGEGILFTWTKKKIKKNKKK